jgi:hypothetical protein
MKNVRPNSMNTTLKEIWGSFIFLVTSQDFEFFFQKEGWFF